jgi:hypothetical protein
LIIGNVGWEIDNSDSTFFFKVIIKWVLIQKSTT